MRLTSILIALSGLAVAGGSVYAARGYLDSQAPLPTDEEAVTMPVLVAARDIAFGQAIEAQAVTAIDWPVQAVPAGVFTNLDDLLPEGGGEPRRARRAIAQGDLLLLSRVSNFGEKVTITQTLAEGYRAMAISVNAETAVGGFVTPGDFVDVVLTQGGRNSQDMSAITILQNIRVIGVDQDSNEENDTPEVARTVTVEVTPDQSQRLALAQRAGTLSLTLRDLVTEEDAPLEAIRLTDLLQETPASAEEGERPPAIVIRRGTLIATETN